MLFVFTLSCIYIYLQEFTEKCQKVQNIKCTENYYFIRSNNKNKCYNNNKHNNNNIIKHNNNKNDNIKILFINNNCYNNNNKCIGTSMAEPNSLTSLKCSL